MFNEHEWTIHTYGQLILDMGTNEPVAMEMLNHFEGRAGDPIPAGCLMDAHEVGSEMRLKVDLECIDASIKASIANGFGVKIFVNVLLDTIITPVFWRAIPKWMTLVGDPKRVVFELIESDSVVSDEEVRPYVDRLKALGCRIAVDDFGAGSSHFPRLIELQPSWLKLDRALVMGCDLNAYKLGVVRSILGFCREFGIDLIAEGIETVTEREALVNLGVTYGQGFVLHRPSCVNNIRTSTSKALQTA